MVIQDSHTARFLYDKLLRGTLLRNRTVVRFPACRGDISSHVSGQVLVTHHVELVLPGAYYYVQMQDGRIHVQGTVHELRQKGILEGLRPELIAEEPEDDMDVDQETDEDTNKVEAHGASRKEGKRPRKLVQEEARQVGGVRWIIYDTYLKASYVTSLLSSTVAELIECAVVTSLG